MITAIDAVLAALGLKKLAVLAGLLGGGISAGLLPGPLALLGALWKRLACGAISGAIIAGFGAVPLSEALDKPNYLSGIALGLGLFGLSFVFKLLKAWNEFDLGATLGKIIDNWTGGNK
jgi:hypothetical protein